MLKRAGILFAALLWAASALAAPVVCNGVASTGSVTLCNSNQTYGINATGTATQILGPDGNRTSVWVQCGGSTGTIVTFNDTAVSSSPYNGMELLPLTAQPVGFYWTNMPQGNTPGRIVTSSVSIISLGGTNPCAFFFTQ